MMADQQYFLPKYYQISLEIMEMIRTGELQPGARIPSENDIIKNFKVSNTTARKVLHEIERAGWVTKIKGKGTFVRNSGIINRSATKVLSFTKNMRQAGLVPKTRLLDKRIIRSGKHTTVSGRTYAIKKPVCKITRLRLANETAMMIEERYISMGFCPGIEKQNLENSLYDIYRDHYNLQITRIDQSLQAIIIPDELHAYFGVDQAIPGFQVHGVTFCGRELVLEMEDSIYRGDRYQFTVQATP
jgi:GntR family transcriptional regulator